MDVLLALLVSLGLASGDVLSPVPATPPRYEIPSILTKPAVDFHAMRASILAKKNVLGVTASTSATATPSALPVTPAAALVASVSGSPTPTPTFAPRTARKSSFVISLLGDSMVDTLGPEFPELQNSLRAMYPQTVFTVHNHGVGGKNINDGLTRVIKPYAYNGTNRPSLVSQKPDIVVIETFGYNPYSFDEGALDTHWLALAYIVDAVKSELPEVKIVLLATIAPDKDTFADGVPYLNFDATAKFLKTTTIKKYLENGIKFAKSQAIPLADVYHRSLDASSDGMPLYINPGDHLHYSEKGRQLVADVITETVVANKLLE